MTGECPCPLVVAILNWEGGFLLDPVTVVT